MLIPRFSVKRMLAIVAGFSAFFAIVSLAVRGHYAWAVSLTLAVSSLVVAFLIYAFFFLIAWWISLLVDLGRGRPRPQSPFAGQTPPPQIITPQDPE